MIPEFFYISFIFSFCLFLMCYFLMKENNRLRDVEIEFFKTRLNSLEYKIEEIKATLDYMSKN